MHITEDERLTTENVSGLHIYEKMNGKKITVKAIKSQLISSSIHGNQTINLKVEGTDDEEELEGITEFVGKMPESLISQGELRSVTMEFLSIRDDPNYLFPGPVLALSNVDAVSTKGEKVAFPPDTMGMCSVALGAVGCPIYSAPLSLLLAIIDKDVEKVDGILAKIRQWPSAYGTSDYEPGYELIHVTEKEIRWDI